ncbi:zinc-dependent metalloprotease family protein [Thalassotalea ganghwensis]
MNTVIKSRIGLLSGCISLAIATLSFTTPSLAYQANGKLPEGRLKQSLSKLPPHVQDKVISKLSSLGIPAIDTLLLEADSDGEIFYVEEGLVTAESQTFEQSSATLPAVDVFKLHSKPNSTNKVFLDFDGGIVSGRAWGGGSSYDTVAYDLDGDPTTFSATERTRIHEIWTRIADDFAAFDIDVTTEAPASFGPDTGWLLFTKDSDANNKALPSQGAGGVAYVGVWGRSNYTYYQPAFVYYNRLGSGTSTYMAEAGSHELGHNLSLSHDGTSTTSYFQGLGANSELSSWAPIMGVGYSKNITQWSKGDYPDANQKQDDIAIITNHLGASSDNEGSSASPSVLVTDANGFFGATNREVDPGNVMPENKGTVQVGDSDWFQFNAGDGLFEVTATPAWDAFTRTTRRGANLDIGIRLYDASGSLIASSGDDSDSNATLAINLSQGIHLLEVFGMAGPYANDYGSQGHYYLNGQVSVGTPDTTPPDPNPMSFEVLPSAVSDSEISMQASTAIDDSGGMVSYQFTCVQGGVGCSTSAWQNQLSYSATGLAAESEYCFTVKARDLSGNVTVSSAQACATTQVAPPQPEPPLAPSLLQVADGQDGTAQLSWQDNSDNEQSFEVERESLHKNGRWHAAQIVATLNADVINYNDASGEGTKRYRVRALNTLGASAWTAWQEVTVTGGGDGGGGGGDKPCRGKKCGN